MSSPGTSSGLVVSLVLLAVGCTDPAGRGTAAGTVRHLATPAQPGSGQSNLGRGADGRLYLSWIEPTPGGHALRFAVWTDTAWSTPRTVAAGERWFVNWADVPSVTALADGTLAAHWLVRSDGSSHAYDVWLSVSRDGGARWSSPERAHSDGTATEHGFVSIVPDRDAFDVVWLDGRQAADVPPGPTALRHARLDRDGRIGPSSVVDDRVCDCCPTDAARSGDGLLLVYRDRSPDEIRDIATARREADVWTAPHALWDDGWKIAGCPVNGPAVAASAAHAVAAWFTVADGTTAVVRLAFTSDGGRTFGAPVRIDDGSPAGRVDVARLADGTARIVWLEQIGTGAAILLRDVAPDGTPGPSRVVTATSIGRASGYPRLAVHGERTFLAWTEVRDDGTIVRTGSVDGPA